MPLVRSWVERSAVRVYFERRLGLGVCLNFWEGKVRRSTRSENRKWCEVTNIRRSTRSGNWDEVGVSNIRRSLKLP